MIKCEDAKVEIEVHGAELMQTIIEYDVTADRAMLACVGCDLTYIYKELVKRYGNGTASTLWYAAYTAYDELKLKGDK